MGITGLLPFLEPATKPCHVSQFRGGTVAVDSYCWLHKGASGCGEDDSFVKYCLNYVQMLLKYGINVIMVFDGNNLPAKAHTESKRRESRQKAKQRAIELLRLGKPDEARKYFRQCVDITPKMALKLIKECRKLNVDCVVAPYEADAQLTFFSIKGIAEVVITEDSDLMLFGCKKVLYKMDINGAGYLVDNDLIYKAMKMRPDEYSFEKFRYMCILSGCDYLDSLPGIGLKKALKFISLTNETNPQIFLDKLPSYLNMRQLIITAEYKENFLIANATLQHQIVFDPFTKKLVPLLDPQLIGTDPSYCRNAGEIFDDEIAFQIAIGNLDPKSQEQLDNWCVPRCIPGFSRSIWSGSYKKSISRIEKRVQEQTQQKQSLDLKMKTLSTTDEEDKQYNEQLNEELQMYKVENTVEGTETIEINETEVETTSSVLEKEIVNPFIKKKQLSKFCLTETSSSTSVVKSRYFSSPNKLLDELVEEAKILSQSSDTENSPKNSIDVTEASETKKRLSPEEILETPEVSEKAQLFSGNSEPKRRKLNTCKFVGLSRKPGQPTLHHFFNNMKK